MNTKVRETGNIIIYIKDVKIQGNIYTRKRYTRGRISDSLNRENKKFIPVTEAKIFDYESGDLLDEQDYLFVNRENILYVKPGETQDNE
ncbi:MAG: hypothetical protein ACQEQC_02910 [Elusimicrobiota bacterium]